jgi:hypothetical protein
MFPVLTRAHGKGKVEKNLVFGKAVRIRHYPVTVNVKRRNKALTTGDELSGKVVSAR